jgi:hypothetical protein
VTVPDDYSEWLRTFSDGLPPDVARIKALLAMYLFSLPPEERREAMLDLTEHLAASMAAEQDAEG